MIIKKSFVRCSIIHDHVLADIYTNTDISTMYFCMYRSGTAVYVCMFKWKKQNTEQGFVCDNFTPDFWYGNFPKALWEKLIKMTLKSSLIVVQWFSFDCMEHSISLGFSMLHYHWLIHSCVAGNIPSHSCIIVHIAILEYSHMCFGFDNIIW